MAEAASHLDLELLSEKRDFSILRPRIKKKPLYRRPQSRWSFFFLIFSIGGVIGRWLLTGLTNFYLPSLAVGLIVFFIQRERVKEVYQITEKGLRVPYTWFFQITIPFSDIIRISDDNITDEDTSQDYSAIRIVLDTPLVKFNTTGMQPPNILLTTQKYDSHELNSFADELLEKNREDPSTPNTLPQRVTDQVNRAWKNRWKLVLLNVFDASTEFLFIIFVIEGVFLGIFNYGVWPVLGAILVGTYFLFVLVVQILNKPQAIIAIRPHDLGPLLYDEEEILTSVRFIVMCRPYTVHLQHCEIIYEEGETQQVGKMTQIHPKTVNPGELTYGVAQIVGNHTKANGAKIQFTYQEKEENNDIVYEVPIYW